VNAATASGRLRLAQAFLRDVRSPDWGLAGQGFRFALSGVVVASVYVTVTTVLHDVFSLPFQVALVIGFVLAVCLHFTLQRLFVWRHHEKFALAFHHQVVRYLCVCGSQYGVTALSTSQLPDLVGLPVEVVYLITMLSIAGLNFVLFRGRVFHPGPRREEQPSGQPSREAMS
jgi:putative flippase GtrA